MLLTLAVFMQTWRYAYLNSETFVESEGLVDCGVGFGLQVLGTD